MDLYGSIPNFELPCQFSGAPLPVKNDTSLKVTRRVDEHMEKMMKNHAVLHDACGFMLNNTDVGPGYLFGIFPHAIINVS